MAVQATYEEVKGVYLLLQPLLLFISCLRSLQIHYKFSCLYSLERHRGHQIIDHHHQEIKWLTPREGRSLFVTMELE